MDSFLTRWIPCIFEYLIFSSFSIGFLKKHSVGIIIKSFLFTIPFSLIATYLEYYLLSNTDALFMNIVVLYIFFLLLFKQSSVNTFFILLLSYASGMIIQSILAVFFTIITIPDSIPIEILGNIITLIITFIISSTSFLPKIYRFAISRNLPVIITITNIFVLALVVNIFNKIFPERFADLIISILIPFIIIVYMDLTFIREYFRQKQDEKKNTIYAAYLPVIDEMIDQIRRRQHSFDNEIQTIKGLANTCSDYTTLKTALLDYSGYVINDQTDTQLLKLNLRFLAALLYQKSEQSKKQNIIMEVDIPSLVLYTNVPEYDILEIAGILIDNMLEATPAGAKCKVSFETRDHKIIITTINPASPVDTSTISSMFTKGYTTKENINRKHGYGLYNLSELVKKYDGRIFIENLKTDNIPELYISVEI